MEMEWYRDGNKLEMITEHNFPFMTELFLIHPDCSPFRTDFFLFRTDFFHIEKTLF
jgi:hypothetical protein